MKNADKRAGVLTVAIAAMTLAIGAQAMVSSAVTVSLSGDANADATFGVADAVLFSKYLGNADTLSAQGAANSDMDGDSILNAIDLTLMKRQLLNATPVDPNGDHVVTAITYSENSVTLKNANGEVVSAADATNVTVSNNTMVTITTPGEYDVDGTCSNGQLQINCDKTTYVDGQVTCNLQGLTLSNSSDSPIYVESIDDEFVLTVKKGYTNTISDGTSYTNADEGVGAIYSRDDMKIKGKGVLIVNGNCEDGIVCKNDLKIWNGDIQVTAVDDGIRGKDSVRIGDPDSLDYSALSVSVKSTAGDGIKSTSTEDGDGFVRINGGTIQIDAMYDGIKGEQAVEINGGDINILTYQVGSNYSGSGSSSGNNGGMGGWGGPSEGNSSSTTESAKGIKAVGLYDESGETYQSGGDITITSGTITVDSADDCIHCAGTISVTGGHLTLSTADDGLHSDTDLYIGTQGSSAYDDVVIDILKSYEGVEAMNIYQYSGSVMVTSSDDGYNAAGGTDSSGSFNPGGWGQGGMGGSSSGSYTLNIYGGYVYINAAGDGLDSNGTLSVSGGYVFVSQTGGGNSPIDCDTTWTYSGGVVIAGGSSDMFSESIPGSYQFVNSSNAGISAGETITFANSSGTVLGTMTFANSASAIVICAPESGTAYKGGTVSGATYFETTTASGGSNMKAGYGGTISGGSTLSSSSSGSNPWGW